MPAEQRIVRLGVLGPIEAWDALGRPVRVTKGQARVLAVLLEAANEVVGANVIQERLWAGGDPEGSKDLLHTNVWTLRNLFGRDADPAATPALLRTGEGYELRVGPLEFDWLRYQRLVAAAGRAINGRRHREAKLFLVDAQRLWRGDALLGVAEDFATPFVQLLEEARAAAALRLIDASLELGEHHELIPQLRHLTGKDPLNEALTRRLMLALFRSGRQAEALEAYDLCRRLLADSGLVPTAMLTNTEVEILTHAPAAMAPAVAPAAPPSWSAMSGTLLVGRWPSGAPPKSALGDAELVLLSEDEGGELIEVGQSSFVARFEEVNSALATAVAIQRELKLRKSDMGRFVVHDGAEAATRGVRLRGLAQQLLAESETGQILLFRSAAGSGRRPPEGSELRELGQHHLPGGDPAVRVFQLMAPHLQDPPRPFALLPTAPTHNLPAPAGNRIVGREPLIERIATELSRRRLVSLTGPGGVGKTRLAVETARTLVSEYRDGTWLVELEWLEDPDLIAGTVADALGVERSRTLPIADVLLREVAPRQLLIVLDTCEHLLAPVRAFVDRLLAACPRVSVIATSLQPLGCDGEEVVAVPPLAVCVHVGPETPEHELRANPAVRLFCECLKVDTAATDLVHVARICELVDGVPLMITLAAARAPHLGLAQMARELERTLSEGGAVALLDAGGKLRERLDWTFSLLQPRDRNVLTQLSLFAGTFTLDEARELCGDNAGDMAATLCRLADFSAIVVESGGGDGTRYQLLHAVRAHGESSLAEDPPAKAVLSARHAEMYLRIAQAADRAFGSRGENDHLGRLDDRLANLRAAFAWSMAEERAELALGLAASLWRFWFARGHLAEGRKCLIEALYLMKEPTPVGIRVLGGSSYLSWWLGDLAYTRTSAEENARLAELIDDGWGRAWAPLGLLAAGMFSPACPPPKLDLRPAIDWFVASGLAWEAGQALQLLAGVDWHRGDIAAAQLGFGRALELGRAAGSQAFTDALQAHGLMLALQGRVAEGVSEIQAGLALADRRGDRVGICHAFAYRAAIARREDDFDESARLYALALRVAYDTGDAWVVQWSLDGLACWVARSRSDVAARLLGKVETLAQATGIRLAPNERSEHDLARKYVARTLGTGMERAFTQGGQMTTAEAVELALGLGA